VTGAAGGIGGAVARLFANAGATVFRVDREQADGVHVADLAIAEETEAAVRACVERHGQLDVAFNGAGGSGRRFGDGPVHECTLEGWQRTLELRGSHLGRVESGPRPMARTLERAMGYAEPTLGFAR
jgi:NAD(P)-dependent dehydrogenase (short-subunit alcohol dehydrogenase family)